MYCRSTNVRVPLIFANFERELLALLWSKVGQIKIIPYRNGSQKWYYIRFAIYSANDLNSHDKNPQTLIAANWFVLQNENIYSSEQKLIYSILNHALMKHFQMSLG